MTFNELFANEREDYLVILTKSLLEYRSKSPSAVAELMLEINSSTKPLPYRIMRIDIAHGGPENPKLVDVNKDKYYNFEPCVLNASGKIPGKLFPFYWNGMEFRLFGEINSWDAFEKWVRYWMDLDDSRCDRENDFSNVIHNVTVPEKVDDYFEFSIDMGSAEVSALTELLSLFSGMNVTKFKIGSFSMIDGLKDA